jgi:hypothetical protein
MNTRRVELKTVKPGDFLVYWKRGWDDETDRPVDELCYAMVLRKGPKRFRVVDRDGWRSWQYPTTFFAKVDDPETIAHLAEDDFREVAALYPTE